MDLHSKIKRGEGRRLEFKVKYTSPVKISQTAIAFANGAGGEILFGVGDDRKLKGIDSISISQLTDQLVNLIYETCHPLIMTEVAIERLGDKAILVLQVFPGADKPYYLKKNGKVDGVFIRVGASTRKANASNIADLERCRRNISFDEEIARDYNLEDLDLELLKKDFLSFTGKALEMIDLLNMNIVKNEYGRDFPTIGGVLIAGKSVFNEYCGVKCARFKGIDTQVFIDKKEYSGPLYKIVEDVMNFSKNHIPLHGEIRNIQRVEQYELPMLAIREALLNAIVHRDYSIDGADVKLAVFDDVIEITSPGCLPNTLDIEDILKGRSEVRNKVVARFFEKIGFIEKWGTGISKMFALCREYGLPKPEFKESGGFFQVIFHRKKKIGYAVKPEIPSSVDSHLGEAMVGYGDIQQKKEMLRDKICIWLNTHYEIKSKKLARLAGILIGLCFYARVEFDKKASKRTCEYDLKFLKNCGLIVFKGARKNGHYELTERARKVFYF